MITKYHILPPENHDRPPWKDPTEHGKHDWLLVRYECEGGTIQYRKQCKICGKITDAIGKKYLSEIEMNSAPVCDRGLRQRILEQYRQEWLASGTGEHDAAWWAWYNEYMKSPIWYEKSQAVIKRAHGICEYCGLERATQAHHRSYHNQGAEPLVDLIAVCKSCHQELEGKVF